MEYLFIFSNMDLLVGLHTVITMATHIGTIITTQDLIGGETTIAMKAAHHIT
jgi:hypothetical protein